MLLLQKRLENAFHLVSIIFLTKLSAFDWFYVLILISILTSALLSTSEEIRLQIWLHKFPYVTSLLRLQQFLQFSTCFPPCKQAFFPFFGFFMFSSLIIWLLSQHVTHRSELTGSLNKCWATFVTRKRYVYKENICLQICKWHAPPSCDQEKDGSSEL